MFKVETELINCIDRMKNWFDNQSGNAKGVVIGISGGKDSTVVATLWTEAIGAKNVVGVLMPNGEQKDIDDAIEVCKILGIRYRTVDIGEVDSAIYDAIRYSPNVGFDKDIFALSLHTQTNIPPRLRMTVLYAIAQELGYRVSGTGNASEAYIGYCTKWGDTACDFNPISEYTTEEVISIGDRLGLPYNLTHKTPSDGLCGKSDEDNLGFTYEVLNKYIRTGICEDEDVKKKIDNLHKYSRHKF